MNELMSTQGAYGELSVYPGTAGVNGFVAELLAAVPYALAKPILDYQKIRTQEKLYSIAIETRKQERLYSIAIEVRKQERADIMQTMQILAQYGQLTPELSQQLMTAYYQPPFPN